MREAQPSPREPCTTSQDDATAPAPGNLRAYWRLVGYARPYLGVLALAVALSAIYAGSRTARAWLLEPIFDQVILPHQEGGERFSLKELGSELLGRSSSEADPETPSAAREPEHEAVRARLRESLPRILLASLLIVLLLPLAHVGQEVLSQWVLGRVLVDLQQRLCEKLLSLPLRFHYGQARGETLSRVMNDAQKAHQSLDLLFQDVVQSAVGLLVGGGRPPAHLLAAHALGAGDRADRGGRDRGLRPAHPPCGEAAPGEPERRHAAPAADPRGHQGDPGVPRAARRGGVLRGARTSGYFRRNMRVQRNRALLALRGRGHQQR